MIDLIASPNPDREAIAAKQDMIAAGQQKMQNLLIEHLLNEKKLLSPDQRREFFGAMRRSMGKQCFGPGRMRGAGRGRGRSSGR